METSAEKPADSPRFRNGRRRHRATKLAPLTRNALDGRSNAIKQFDAIASSIVADLGGEDQLTTVQRHLIEAFAGASITVDNLNARLLLGEKLEFLNTARQFRQWCVSRRASVFIASPPTSLRRPLATMPIISMSALGRLLNEDDGPLAIGVKGQGTAVSRPRRAIMVVLASHY
jgi:hypothetical protein